MAYSIKRDFRRELDENCKDLSARSAPEQHLWPESIQKNLQSRLLVTYVDSDFKICFIRAIIKQYHMMKIAVQLWSRR